MSPTEDTALSARHNRDDRSKRSERFDGLLVCDDGKGGRAVSVERLSADQLPEGDVTVQVEWSCLNYKDALGITGSGPILRRLPMVPGVDFAGTVTQSASPEVAVGDRVILNGWGVGETRWGGFAKLARVEGAWLTPCPADMSPRAAMSLGTAGYTAMLCVQALRDRGLTPSGGPVLVTGASGGVGSVAVLLLKALGHEVTAVTSRSTEKLYLLDELGADSVIGPDDINPGRRPFGKPLWSGVIDVCGGDILTQACAATRYGGTVAACGLAAAAEFSSSVMPFILRGVGLLGIDSVMRPQEDRIRAWEELALLLPQGLTGPMTREIGLHELTCASEALLDRQLRGRTVVRLDA